MQGFPVNNLEDVSACVYCSTVGIFHTNIPRFRLSLCTVDSHVDSTVANTNNHCVLVFKPMSLGVFVVHTVYNLTCRPQHEARVELLIVAHVKQKVWLKVLISQQTSYTRLVFLSQVYKTYSTYL